MTTHPAVPSTPADPPTGSADDHWHDCMCPRCEPMDRPDFLLAVAEIIEQGEHVTSLYAALPDPDVRAMLIESADRARDRRLMRHVLVDMLWDFPDHFAVSTARRPAVRDEHGDWSLVRVLAVHDQHGRAVETLRTDLHAGYIADCRTRTVFDSMRVDPDDPDSPVVVGHVRDWFLDDEGRIETT
jgi:hypothetical protein